MKMQIHRTIREQDAGKQKAVRSFRIHGLGGSRIFRQMLDRGEHALGFAAAGKHVAELNGRDANLLGGFHLTPSHPPQGIAGVLHGLCILPALAAGQGAPE